jgi:hypothetical protein
MGIKTIEFVEVGDRFDAEGKGSFEVIARFWDGVEANKYAKGRGNYGADALCRSQKLTIADTCADMDDYRTEQVRLKAMEKLTEDEKRALGLIR